MSNSKEKLMYLNKRICGIWLVWIGFILLIGTLFGGRYEINPFIFFIGYPLGMVTIFKNKKIKEKFSFGSPSRFQKRMATFSIVLMFILMSIFSGRYFQTMDYRMIWLGALLATALHFVPFSFVHGKTLLFLAVPLAIVAILGMTHPTIPFSYLGFIDGIIKMIVGILMLSSKKIYTPNALHNQK